MPLYEFDCDGCGNVWEEYRKMSECSLPASCPICQGNGSMVFSVHSGKPFRCRVISHVGPEPVYVESQSQLDKLCKDNESVIVTDDRRKQRKYHESRKRDIKRSKQKRMEKMEAIGKR